MGTTVSFFQSFDTLPTWITDGKFF